MANNKSNGLAFRDRVHLRLMVVNMWVVSLFLWVFGVVMALLFGVGAYKILKGILLLVTEKEASLGDCLHGLELLFFAPLPFILTYAIGIYCRQILPPLDKASEQYKSKDSWTIVEWEEALKEILKDQQNELIRSKHQILTVKAFVISLLIALLTTNLIDTIIVFNQGQSNQMNVSWFLCAIILVSVLIVYLLILEHFSEKQICHTQET